MERTWLTNPNLLTLTLDLHPNLHPNPHLSPSPLTLHLSPCPGEHMAHAVRVRDGLRVAHGVGLARAADMEVCAAAAVRGASHGAHHVAQHTAQGTSHKAHACTA
eukprot:scaffold30500_cov60-Phaeocystis_antarctica.AAC.4